MDTEIQDIFQRALEPETEARSPEELAEEIRRETVRACAITAAVAASGTRDPELLKLLLERQDLSVERDEVPGLEEALEEIRRDRPYLFSDSGGRPRFSAATMDRGLFREEETVARRYRDNPWYRRK